MTFGCSIEVLAVFKRGPGVKTEKKKSAKKKRPSWGEFKHGFSSKVMTEFKWDSWAGCIMEGGKIPISYIDSEDNDLVYNNWRNLIFVLLTKYCDTWKFVV